MKINLTSPAAALAFLRSLPSDQAISLPGRGENETIEGDAVRAITGNSANGWASTQRRWDWTAAELVEEMAGYVEGENTLEEIVEQNDEAAQDAYNTARNA